MRGFTFVLHEDAHQRPRAIVPVLICHGFYVGLPSEHAHRHKYVCHSSVVLAMHRQVTIPMFHTWFLTVCFMP